MTEYYPKAWDDLLELRHITVYEMLEELKSLEIEPHSNTFLNWRRKGTIPPDYLVKICNHFHFPISFFTRVKGESVVRNYRIISDEEWKDVEIKTERIVEYLTCYFKLPRKATIKRIDCSPQMYDVMRKSPDVPLPPKLSFEKILTFINNARMYPGDVLVDRNEPFMFEQDIRPFYDNEAMDLHDKKFTDTETVLVTSEMKDLITRQALEIENLKKIIEELKEIIVQMGGNPHVGH